MTRTDLVTIPALATRFLTAAITMATVAVSGCAKAPGGPPELRLGREECGECGMLVSEDRCSSAMLVEHEGEQLYVFFDDLGCMLDYERSHADEIHVKARYVHDYQTRTWIPAEQATYVHMLDREFVTPMASRIIAFGGRADAEAMTSTRPGELLIFTSLPASRLASKHAHEDAATSPTPDR